MSNYVVLDISKYNNVTNYNEVSSSIDGVIIRAGYRGYGVSGTLTLDSMFNNHYKGFYTKTKIGIYWQTNAISVKEAIEETDFLYNNIKDKQIDFPIYLYSDYGNDTKTGRADSLSREDRMELCITFLERIKSYGYRAGIYASDSWLGIQLDWEELYAKGYSIWDYKYSIKPPTVCTKYDGWQYTNTATLIGIDGNVNMSYFYNDVANWKTVQSIIPYVIGITPTSFIYDGYTHIPTAVFTKDLIVNKDYKITYDSMIEKGEHTATIIGINNYSGSVSLPFYIIDKPKEGISKYINGISNTEYYYDGSSKEPSIITELILDEDYSVEYKDNIEIGKGLVIITGINDYEDTVQYSFDIVEYPKINISDYIHGIDVIEYEYDGEEKEPNPITDLSKDIDYKISYIDNINIGTATMVISGIGEYSSSVTYKFNIKKHKENIADYIHGIDNIEYKYDDTAKEPNPITDLSKDIDYTIEYFNNINIGTAVISIYGINDYEGSISYTFSIVEEIITVKTSIYNYLNGLDNYKFIYDGTDKKPNIKTDLILNEDYLIKYSSESSINCESYTIKILGIHNYEGVATFTYTILPINFTDKINGISNYNYTYDGFAKTPEVNTDLILNENYKINYSSNINVGTGIISIVGINNYLGSISYHFNINKLSIYSDIKGLIDNNFIYNKKEQNVEIDTELILDEEYSIYYIDNIANGIATAIISGINNRKGDIEYSYNILKDNISNRAIGINPMQYEYTGRECNPLPIFNIDMEYIEDYSIIYKDNIEIGTGYIKINGNNNYIGFTEYGFNIIEPSPTRFISDYIKELVEDTFTYDGSEKKPKAKSDMLIEDIDYIIEYINNINAGTAIALVKGINNFVGEANLRFTILPQDITGKEFGIEIEDNTYSGKVITGNTYIKGLESTDFRTTYTNNINAGTATYRLTGIGNYNGILNGTFEIKPKPLSKDMFSIPKSVYKYTGLPIEPEVSCNDPYCNYNVSYINNIEIGTAIIVISAGTNYTGSVELTFVINVLDINNCDVIVSDYTFTYNGKENKPIISIYDNNDLLIKNVDYIEEYSDPINAGTVIVKLSGKGSYIGTRSFKYTILPKSISDRMIILQQKEYYYKNEPIKPEFTISGTPLVLDVDYKVSYTNNINPGTGFISINGIKNYNGYLSTEFYIKYNTIETVIPLYGKKSKISEKYRIDNDVLVLYKNEDMTEVLKEGFDYKIINKYKKQYKNDTDTFNVVYITVKGLEGYSGEKSYKFITLSKETSNPDTEFPDPLADDGVYNFGDIDEHDQTSQYVYDFGELGEEIDPESIAEGIYDFNIFSSDGDSEYSGDFEFDLFEVPVYTTYSNGSAFTIKSGHYYIYNTIIKNNRVRICRTEYAVDSPAKSIGWCNVNDLININKLSIGDKVIVNGKLYLNPDGTGTFIEINNEIKYIRDIIEDEEESIYPYLISSKLRSSPIGFASADILEKVKEDQ